MEVIVITFCYWFVIDYVCKGTKKNIIHKEINKKKYFFQQKSYIPCSLTDSIAALSPHRNKQTLMYLPKVLPQQKDILTDKNLNLIEWRYIYVAFHPYHLSDCKKNRKIGLLFETCKKIVDWITRNNVSVC